MTKRSQCKACFNAKHGIKTRKSVPHTCNQIFTTSEARCPRCAMLCESTVQRNQYGDVYQNYHCFECGKPFSILISSKNKKHIHHGGDNKDTMGAPHV